MGNLVPRADLQTSSRSLMQNVSRNPGQELCDLNLMYQYPFHSNLMSCRLFITLFLTTHGGNGL